MSNILEMTTPQPPPTLEKRTIPLQGPQEPMSIAPVIQQPPGDGASVIGIEVTEEPLPVPSSQIPSEKWTIDTTPNQFDNLVLTMGPSTEPSTLEPIEDQTSRDFGPHPYTQKTLSEPPWFPKLYMIIDSDYYTKTGSIRVLTAVGNALSVDEYRPRDMGQVWFTNFKGYVKNASTNGLLTSGGECVAPGLTDSISNAVMWNFKPLSREREYDIVAQCGHKLHVPSETFAVTLDPIGSPWFIVPVARVEF